MNDREGDILNLLAEEPYINQRVLAESSGYSLGTVNKAVKSLISEGYIDRDMNTTEKAAEVFRANSPKNAVILAAGFGMRMVPINTETPKALLEVRGEKLIERIIRQLHEAGITEIYVVVGFMKERFEYLIDDFGVKLVYNGDYAAKNNLWSMKKASEYLENTYVIPCDIRCENNPFSSRELYSWYMVSSATDSSSKVRVNRSGDLVVADKHIAGSRMVGIAYLTADDCEKVKENIESLCNDKRNDGCFWEEALYLRNKAGRKDRMLVSARIVDENDVVEINTYEQLREFDENSDQLKTEAISVICEALEADPEEVNNIEVLKKGMTNRSFLFKCKGKKYIMRIPGEGTDMLINRSEEAAVYKTIEDKNLCDNIAYIDPNNGYKITEYFENAGVCDPLDTADVKKCMKRLREFHEMELRVSHTFDIFGQIEFYESLWKGEPSVFKDYKTTKANVFSLKSYIDKYKLPYTLTHIDAVPDNFLFVRSGGKEDIRLIDWEYAGMQDRHVDIAMFAIYSIYDRKQTEALIDAYFTEGCPDEARIKIYCYIAACGLLWSNWCEYKRALGVEFGEYSLQQYRYAKEYYSIAVAEMKRLGLCLGKTGEGQ